MKGWTELMLRNPNQEVSLSAGGAKCIRFAIKSEISSGSIAVKLQTKSFGEWIDLTSPNSYATISSSGVTVLKMAIERLADQVDMPLGDTIRVVSTPSESYSGTIEVRLSQPQ